MRAILLLAPGPTATPQAAELAQASGLPVGAVSNAYMLIRDPLFIAASDHLWWTKYEAARQMDCAKYASHEVKCAKRITTRGIREVPNSGVLALEVARILGFTRILLSGYDMHGTHFFGAYANGLTNTSKARRVVHMRQYADWARMNECVDVINCTAGSALTAFPHGSLADELAAVTA